MTDNEKMKDYLETAKKLLGAHWSLDEARVKLEQAERAYKEAARATVQALGCLEQEAPLRLEQGQYFLQISDGWYEWDREMAHGAVVTGRIVPRMPSIDELLDEIRKAGPQAAPESDGPSEG